MTELDGFETSRLDPRYPDSLCALAWLCATCPDAKFRDAARSLELAKRSCELTEWKKPCFLGTLAALFGASQAMAADKPASGIQKLKLSDDEWKKRLSPEAYAERRRIGSVWSSA